MGLSTASAATPAAHVLAWWVASDIREERDELPWRRPGMSPWGILVSETMLAQTQVRRVAERFPAFMERYRSPDVLADDPLGEVLQIWQGLGYPRRALNLQRCAALLVARHAGEVPDDLGSLLALPGVGRYTARAVLAFAFDEPTMPIDTNIGRVLARLGGSSLREGEAQAMGDALVAGAEAAGGGREPALAFMDLGAMLCRPVDPRCPECPLHSSCVWGRARLAAGGRVPPDPATGSARVSRPQARFDGSDRQGRGRLLRAAASAPFAAADLAHIAGWPDDPARSERVAASLVEDGLLTFDETCYRLP
ncbi:MAG: A/G-specific adenine glycosylase [Acidimicrobiales bacterium]